MATKTWQTHRVKFDDLKKALNTCSNGGYTIHSIFISTAIKGYYEIVSFKDVNTDNTV